MSEYMKVTVQLEVLATILRSIGI